MSEEEIGASLMEAMKGGEPQLTAAGAVVEGVKEGVSAFIEGIGQAFDIAQASPDFNAFMAHGLTELAAATNGQADGFAMYGWAQPANDNPVQPSPEVSEPQITGPSL